MPASTAPSSVQVIFYDSDGIKNTSYSGQLNDSRNMFVISTVGDSRNVLSSQLFIDSAAATDSAYLKTFALKMGTGNNIVHTDASYPGMTGSYSFAESTNYALKLKIVLNTAGFPTLYAKFSIAGGAETPSYNFRYRTASDTISATVENVDDIQTNSTIKIAAPVTFYDSGDLRRPKDVFFTFDAYESLTDTDNLEGLSSYTVTTAYKPSPSKYDLLDNKLANDNKYACTVTAVYEDGYSISTNVLEPIYVVSAPVILSTSVAYGLDDKLNSGDISTSTVAVIKLQAGSTPVNVSLYDGNVTFQFKQGSILYYSITTAANSATNQYTIMRGDLTQEYADASPPVQNSDAAGSFGFDVYALVNYNKTGGYFTKTSAAWSDTYTLDIIPLSNVTIESAWISAAVTTVSGKQIVENSNATSMSGYNAAPTTGLVGQFNKTNFFGTGVSAGLFKNLDTTDTQFKFEISVNGGSKINVPQLSLIQGDVGASDQNNYITLLGANVATLQDGKADNIPFSSVLLGQNQPALYFSIPADNSLYTQSDVVVVAVSITSKAKGITLAAGTASNSLRVVNKVKTYAMTLGSASEPSMSGSGSGAVLTVPINDSTDIITGDYYLTHGNFYSNLTAPNNYVTVAQTNNGAFNILISNPLPVDSNCKYSISYNINNPNNNTSIEGPKSIESIIQLSDESTAADNLEVTNYLYNTFADPTEPKVASFSFDIKFMDVTKDGRRLSTDGANVYFMYGSNSTLVKTISRGDGDIQTGINVVLQSSVPAASDSGILVNGIYWPNWKEAAIVFKAFKTPNVVSDNDAQGPDSTDSTNFEIFYIPSIPAPTNYKLTGGVKEMYKETSVGWTNTLSAYGSDVTPSYVLTLSNSVNTAPVDKSAEITTVNTTDVYAIDITTLAANTEYNLVLMIKLAGKNGYVWYGTTQTITFTSVSVNESSRAVSVKRDSGINVLKASFGNHTTDPVVASNLVSVERKIVDNVNNVSDPENSGIRALENGTADAVQADNITHSYNLMDAGYSRGNNLKLQLRSKVSLNYTLTTDAGAPAPQTSVSQYISLAAAPKTTYTVAAAPLLTVGDGYTVQNNQITIPFKCDAMGLEVQGLSSLTVILSQESDLTDAGDTNAGQGAVALLSYGPDSNVLTPGISGLNGVSTNLTDAQMTTVKADSTLAVTTVPGVNGWAIKNGAAPVVNGVVTGAVPKVNLYYYANAVAAASQSPSNSFTLGQVSGLGLYAVFNQNSGAKQYPFFIAYTTPTAADNKSSWYKSKVFYAPASGSPLNAGLTLAYSGADDFSFFPEIPAERRVQYEVNLAYSNANAGYSTELVNLLSLQTSGNAASTNAGDFNFHLLETGHQASFGLVSLKYNVYSDYSKTIYSYAAGPDASATDATDYLAAGEIRTTTPENLTDTVGAIESGNYELQLGTLGLNDTSRIVFSSLGGVDATKNIFVVMIATTLRGTAVSSKNISPPQN